MMCFRLWVLAIVACGVSLTNVSCISVEDNASVEIREEGFFTGEVNALIDANYPEVMANGYAELVIPSTMFDPGIMQYADYHKETISGAMNNYYICKGFGDGCVRRTYEYYKKYGIADYFMLGLKGYVGTSAYEEPMLKALDYIESKTKVTLELAMAAMYLPVMKARMADKEQTLENITTLLEFCYYGKNYDGDATRYCLAF